MKRVSLSLALLLSAPAAAQIGPVPFPLPSEPVEVPALQSDLILRTGSDRVFFGGGDYGLSVPARTTLAAHARWLLANPSVRVSIEGHSDERDTRDHAIALGERRATAVRDYLVSLGVQPVRLSVTSWGKERPIQPGPADVGFNRNPRVVLVIMR